MSENNYVPERWAPFLYLPEPRSSHPHIEVVVNPKKPIGFADWPEDSKTEWKKA